MRPVEMGVVASLGAILGLDVVSFPQAMLSRPLVACTISAGLLGQPVLGVMLGAILECFALETLPVGASRYPEWGSSSAVGGAVIATLSPTNPDAALALAVITTLVMAWFGGWSMVQLRLLNAKWARARHEAVARGSRNVVNGLQLYGMTADLLRGGLMTLLGLAIALPLGSRLAPRWDLPLVSTPVALVTVAGIVAAGAVWKVFHSTTHSRSFFLAGLAVGLLALVAR